MEENHEISGKQGTPKVNLELLFHFIGAVALSSGVFILGIMNADYIERKTGIPIPSFTTSSESADTSSPPDVDQGLLITAQGGDDLLPSGPQEDMITALPGGQDSSPTRVVVPPLPVISHDPNPPAVRQAVDQPSFEQKDTQKEGSLEPVTIQIIDPIIAKLHRHRNSKSTYENLAIEKLIVSKDIFDIRLMDLSPPARVDIPDVDYESLSTIDFCILDCQSSPMPE
jgi:hypothetical protein